MSAKKTVTISATLAHGGYTSKTWVTSSSNPRAFQGCYTGSDTAYSDSRVGVIYFSGLGATVKNCNISEITLTVTTSASGFNNDKTVYFKESNYQTINTSYNPSAYVGSDLGTVEGTFYANESTTVLNKESSSSLFTKMRNYFKKGNSVLIIYSGETDVISSTYPYSTNYLGWSAVTISITYSDQGVWIYYNGSWVQAIPWIYYDGNWVQAVPWIYSGSAWTSCGSG